MKKSLLNTLAVSILLLSGCAVGPTYRSPDVVVPLDWSTETPIIETDPDVWPSSDWWSVFQSIELDALIKEGMEYNYDLKAALSRIYEARARAIIVNSNFYPEFGITGEFAQKRAGSGPRSKSYDVFGFASYEVDLWGKLMYERQAAYAEVLVSLYDQEALRLSIMSAIASTFFRILSLNDRLDIAKKSVASFTEVLRIAKARFQMGYTSQLDLLQQETSLLNVEASIPDLEQQRSIAMNTLQVLVGRIPTTICIEDIGLGSLCLPDSVPTGLPSLLLERRPDVKSLEEELIAANALIGVATANFFPDFALTGDSGFSSSELKDLFNFHNRFYNFLASVTETVFSGYRLEGEYMLAQAKYCEFLANYYEGVINAFRDVENALVSIEKLTEQQRILNEAVLAATESYRLSELNYTQGFADFLFVLSAENTLLSTQDSIVQTLLESFDAYVALFTALGGGWIGTCDDL